MTPNEKKISYGWSDGAAPAKAGDVTARNPLAASHGSASRLDCNGGAA